MIKPLLKKNGLDLDLCKNYRPVSNLPYVSKLLERVVAKQLVSLVDRHDLPDKFQAAYLPGHSCETALLRVLGDVLCSADGDDLVLLYPCASALHLTPSTGTPLTRLRDEVGISGAAHQWFCSYLTDRTQHVTVNQASSADKPLTCGVPHGSVLGPILFSLNTTQLGRIILIERHDICLKLFADDIELYRTFHPDPSAALTAVRAVEECWYVIKAWMTTSKLKVNDEKTEAIICAPKASQL